MRIVQTSTRQAAFSFQSSAQPAASTATSNSANLPLLPAEIVAPKSAPPPTPPILVPVAAPSSEFISFKEAAEPNESKESEEDSGGGLGNEGDGDGDGDGDGVEEEEGEEGIEVGEPRRRHKKAEWILKKYNEISLQIKSTRNPTTKISAVHRRFKFSSNPLEVGYGSGFIPQDSISSILTSPIAVDPTSMYNPQFYYFDPQPLFEALSCPRCCVGILGRNGSPPSPRKIVDLDRNIYLMGEIYICRPAGVSKVKERDRNGKIVEVEGEAGVSIECCGKTIYLYDKLILAMLPYRIQHSFPFILTWRSGVTKKLLMNLIASFQRGIGSNQYSDMIREQHLEEYQSRECAYLQHIQDLPPLQSPSSTKLPSMSTYDDPLGNSGYVPTGNYMASIFNTEFRSREPLITQHTSLLTFNIGACDHTFKVSLILLYFS